MSKLPRLCAVALLLAAGPAHAESGDGDADSPSAGSLSEFVDFDLRTLLSLEVEGAARRPQARLEAPQAVYVLTRDDIRESGATNLAELLRQVPGVFVVQSSATTFTVGIRGVNASTQLINRGMLVLVDGRQTLERGFGIQPWWSLGVELSDIERVEVVRGPGSVVYGSNALTGVINIVTRSPLDAEGVDLDAWGSIAALSEQRSSSRARARAGGGAALAYTWNSASKRTGIRLSAAAARIPEWEDLDSPFINGPFQYNLRGALEHRFRQGRKLKLSLSHTDGESLGIQTTLAGQAPLRIMRQALTLRFTEPELLGQPLALRLELSASRLLLKQAAPNTIVDDALLTDSSMYYDTRLLTLFDLTLWDGRYVLTAGLEGTFYAVTQFFGELNFLFGGLIVNNELCLFERKLILQAGARFELVRAQRKGLATVYYETISPRVALVWRIAAAHSLRISVSSAFATPSPLESFAAVSAQIASPPAPRNYFVVGNPDLEAERLVAVEIGYLGSPLERLSLETTLFAQRLSNRIERISRDILPATQVNFPTLEQIGWELAAEVTPWSPLALRSSYTIIYGRDRDTGERNREWPTHLLNFAATWRYGLTHLGADASLAFDYAPTVYSRVDQGTIRERVTFELEHAAAAAYVNLRIGRYLLDEQLEVGLSVRNLLGFFRPREDLRAFPHPSSQPLGGAIMLSIKGERL